MTWTYVLYSYVLLPLLAFAYVAVGVWLMVRVASGKSSIPIKVGLSLAILVAFVLVPVGDVLVGRTRFSKLCQEEAGVRVIQHVVLDDKYRELDGSPAKTYVPGQSSYTVADRYEIRFLEKELFHWPRITRFVVQIVDTQRSQLVGERVNFHYWGGWLAHQLPFHLSADSCPQVRETSLEQAVFRRK